MEWKRLKWVKEKYPHIKVVAHTSYGEISFMEEMFAAGASAYLTKGTDLQQIRQTIIQVME